MRQGGSFIPLPFGFIFRSYPNINRCTASVLGRILPSWAGDKFGRFNVTIIITWLCSIFVFAVWTQARTNSVIILFSALYGFTSGSFVAMIPALVMQLAPTTELGVRLATNSMAVSVAVLLGNPIGGAFLGPNGEGFIGLQAFAGGTMAIGASIFVLARLSQSRKLFART
jgi:MFS family permease